MKIIIIFIILLISFGITKSQIVINEIAASNFRNFYDEDYDDSDWLELYNKSDKPVNLKGWKIYDKDEIDNAFVLPDTIIQPKERIVIFASGKDRYSSGKYFVETTGMGIAAHLTEEHVHFKYMEMSGDFEAEITVDKIISKRDFSGVGILFKEELNYDSRLAGVLSNNVRDAFSGYFKNETKSNPKFYQGGHFPDTDYKIKIVKKGNHISYWSIAHNNYDFYKYGEDSLEFEKGYLGIVVAAADITLSTRDTFIFSNFKINNKLIEINQLNSIDLSYNELNTTSKQFNEIHTNFSLNKDGEVLFLFNEKNELIDKVEFGNQQTNLTYSRYPDGENNFYYSEPSPTATNNIGFEFLISPPIFSKKSTYNEKLNKVEINHENPNVEIYYTLDGTEPTKDSYYYQNQILLDTSVVIRAKAFIEGGLCINDVSFTYLPDEKTKLPVVTLILDEDKLTNEKDGLFTEENLFKDIEIPVHFSFIENKTNISFNSNAGLKLHGKASRFNIQKSFRIYARSIYNNDYFDFLFWDKNGSKKTKRFVLKNGGQDQKYAFIRDQFANVLIKYYLESLIYVEYKPIISYINSDYYGILLLRERFDEHFIAEKFAVSESSVNILDNDIYLKEGDISVFKKNYDKLLSSEDSIEIFQIFNDYFDINSFLEYTFIRFFSAEQDWPVSNQIIWNSKQVDTKWRWCPNDFDLSMGQAYTDSYYNKDMFDFLSSKGGLYKNLLFKMMKFNNFNHLLGNLFADKLNKDFKPKNTINILDSISILIKPEIERYNELYNDNLSEFDLSLSGLKGFLNNRPKFMFENAVKHLQQSGTNVISLTSNKENAGRFQVNSIEISESSWTGTYFNEIPISVSVKSNPGYRFIGWENLETQDSVLKDILITDINKFNAVFELTGDPIENPIEKIVINEIMYRSAENQECGDWVELYNAGNGDANLSDWYLKDDNEQNIYFFPEGTILKKGEYMIIAENILDFKKYYGLNGKIIGDFDFGFGTDDLIRIYDSKDKLIDQVAYSNKTPWDNGADKTGNSLELINPELDNTLPWNWYVSSIYGGTPLEINSQTTTYTIPESKIHYYPNPVKNKLYIENDDSKLLNIRLFDLLGNELLSFDSNKSLISIDFSNYSLGMYFININNENNKYEFKIIKE